MNFNEVFLKGNLTREPELKTLPKSGSKLCTVSVATNTKIKNPINGEVVEEVCFVDVVCWGLNAEKAGEFRKGEPIVVKGTLKLGTWPDKRNGEKRSKHTVHALDIEAVRYLGEEKQERVVQGYSNLEQKQNGFGDPFRN